MRKFTVTTLASLLIATTSFAANLELGVKLYKDGLYDLASKTFRENFSSITSETFKKNYKYIYLSFLKSNDVEGLKNLINYWENNLPEFKRGELLALKVILLTKEGKGLNQNVVKELKTLTISEKINFFKTLASFKLPKETTVKLLKLASQDIDLKGAAKEGSFLEATLKRAIKQKDYQLIDFIFNNFGKWFKGKEEEIEYVRYLERKRVFPDALVEAEKLFKNHPSDETRVELAKALFLNKKYQKALNLLKEPKTEEERYLKAWCLYKLGRGEEIPKVLGIKIHRPEIPEKLKTLLNFYSGTFDWGKLKNYYPELYLKALIFSFSTEVPLKPMGNLNDLGYIYYERGLYDKALKTLEKAVQNPSDKLLIPRTLFILGKLATINREVGTVIYNQLMNQFQNTPYYKEGLIPTAKVYLYSGNNLLALKLLNFAESLKNQPKWEVKNLKGRVLMNLGQYKEAAKSFLSSKWKGGEERTFEAFCLYKVGNFKGTYRVLKFLVKNRSVYPQVNEGRLIYLSKQLKKEKELNRFPFTTPLTKLLAQVVSKNYKELEKEYSNLSGRERKVADLVLSLYYEKENPRKASFYLTDLLSKTTDQDIQKFTRNFTEYLAYTSNNFSFFLESDPKFILYNPENLISSVDTILSKADDFMERRNFGKAYQLLKLALERTKDPYLKKGIVVRMVELDVAQKNYSKALKDLELLPQENENDKDLRNFLLSKIYSKMGRILDAFNSAKEVKNLENVPKEERAEFIAKLSSYYKLAGDKKKALKLTESIPLEELSKVSYDDLLKLAIFADNQKRLDLAERFLKEAEKKAKTKEQKAEVLFWKASTLEEKGNLENALLNYLKITYEYPTMEPWSSTATYRAAKILEKQGKLAQAVKLYEKVAKMKRGTEEGEIAAEKVKSLLQIMKGRKDGNEE